MHIRYEKFGKLREGLLVRVNNCLLRKMKTHFWDIEGVDIIFGLNGFIWLSSQETGP